MGGGRSYTYISSNQIVNEVKCPFQIWKSVKNITSVFYFWGVYVTLETNLPVTNRSSQVDRKTPIQRSSSFIPFMPARVTSRKWRHTTPVTTVHYFHRHLHCLIQKPFKLLFFTGNVLVNGMIWKIRIVHRIRIIQIVWIIRRWINTVVFRTRINVDSV